MQVTINYITLHYHGILQLALYIGLINTCRSASFVYIVVNQVDVVRAAVYDAQDHKT